MFTNRLSDPPHQLAASRREARCGVYTVEQAASRLAIGRTLAYELIRRGEFPVPAIRLGRRIVVPMAKLDALLGAGEPPSHPSACSDGVAEAEGQR